MSFYKLKKTTAIARVPVASLNGTLQNPKKNLKSKKINNVKEFDLLRIFINWFIGVKNFNSRHVKCQTKSVMHQRIVYLLKDTSTKMYIYIHCYLRVAQKVINNLLLVNSLFWEFQFIKLQVHPNHNQI